MCMCMEKAVEWERDRIPRILSERELVNSLSPGSAHHTAPGDIVHVFCAKDATWGLLYLCPVYRFMLHSPLSLSECSSFASL